MFLKRMPTAITERVKRNRALLRTLFLLLEERLTVIQLRQLHSQIVIHGFYTKRFLISKLISSFITQGDLIQSFKVFSNTKSKSTSIWNHIIRAYSRTDSPQKSIQIYKKMASSGVNPNSFTYSFVLCACSKSAILSEGVQVHAKVISSGFSDNLFVRTNLVNFYATTASFFNNSDNLVAETSTYGDCSSRNPFYEIAALGNEGGALFRSARKVFDEITAPGIVSWNSFLSVHLRCGDLQGAETVFSEMPYRNVVSWCTMVSWCTQHGRHGQALSIFGEMVRQGVSFDQVVLVPVLSACATAGDLRLGMMIHSHVIGYIHEKDYPPLTTLQNALVHMYSSCGSMEMASKVFENIQRRSTVSWTTLINGYAKQGFPEKALDTFRKMGSLGPEGPKPDAITFLGVLCACSYGGFVEKGRLLFENMSKIWGITPGIKHYGCMVDLLSRSGNLCDACELVRMMPMKPNVSTWGALLGGCMAYNNVGLASHIAPYLLAELDPEEAAGYFMLLMNIYASASMWDDVTNWRKKMSEIGANKPQGKSWVHEGGSWSLQLYMR